MRISLIAAVMGVVSSTALAQQQPTIQVPVPNIPGVTTPSQQQRQYNPPDQGYPSQPYRGDQGYRGGDYRGDPGSRCQQLADQEHDIRDRLADAPPSGQQHDRLVYQLGQIRNQQQRCR